MSQINSIWIFCLVDTCITYVFTCIYMYISFRLAWTYILNIKQIRITEWSRAVIQKQTAYA